MSSPVLEGEAPKSAVEVISEVLTEKCPSNTFLKNVGLDSTSGSKSSKTNAAVTAHVHNLEQQLKRSQRESEVMREEMAAMKKKAEEAEAAQAEHFELLLKKTEESDVRLAHMIALLTGKPAGN
jgi:hypothetical protein